MASYDTVDNSRKDGSDEQRSTSCGVPYHDASKEEENPYQSRCKACGSFIAHNFEEFSGKTSLHAVQYVGDSGRKVFERLCWLLAIVASLGVCFYLIKVQWQKWEDTPVIVSLSEKPTPIWNIPFPAVTICPENKVKQSLYNFTEIFDRDNKTEEEMQMYYQMELLCEFPEFSIFEMSEYSAGTINFSTNYIEKAAPKIDDIMIRCLWMGVENGCRQYFTPVFTDEGWCYTFNALNAKDMFQNEEINNTHTNILKGPDVRDWTLENGYTKQNRSDISLEDLFQIPDDEDEKDDLIYLKANASYPRRTSKSGSKGGLTVYLKTDAEDLDYACRWPVMGFKVLLHNPMDFPRLSDNFFRISLKRDVVAAVQADITTSSPDIAQYPVESRGCFFQNERQLRYFKNYTQRNCELECFVNGSIVACGCVPFYFKSKENITVCETRSLCYAFLSEYMLVGDFLLEQCQCYPSCVDVNYNPQVTQSQLVWPQVLRFMNVSDVKLSDNFGRLSIYFQNIQFVTSRRSELFGYTDFLANCGGLLGLCCGFSVLSAVEIIYFVSLCLCRRRAGR